MPPPVTPPSPSQSLLDASSQISEEELDGGGDSLLSRAEIGYLAHWSVSSHKYGFGVDNLRDGNDSTFWQSEGAQPHTIDLSFSRRVDISAIGLHMSHPRDDSYTPSKIGVRAGTGVHDLQEVRYMEFAQPDGWHLIPLRPMEMSGEGSEKEGPPIPCHFLRIVIFANHLNGKDTHVRGLRVFGPPGSKETTQQEPLPAGLVGNGDDPDEGKMLLQLGHDGLSDFTSVEFRMHERIR